MSKFHPGKSIKGVIHCILNNIVLPLMKWTVTFLSLMSAKIEAHTFEPAEFPKSGWKKKAMEDFGVWLTELPEELPHDRQVDMDACDLYTLLREFTALRQEIKLQNREQSNTLRNQKSLVEILHNTGEVFKERTVKLEMLEERIRLESEKKAILPFLDVRDGLIRGLESAKATAATKRLFIRPPRGIEGIVKGYEMALRRFDRALSYFGITLVDALGKPFDPATMRAVGQGSDLNKKTGVVIEEQVGGFVRRNEVIRTAEVIVNK